MHSDEIPLDKDLARHLIADAYPSRSQSDVRYLESAGTVNTIFRVDDDLAARFPRRSTSAAEIEREAAATTAFAAASMIPTPETVAICQPTADYPSAWSLQSWLPGVTATSNELSDLATDLVQLISRLREADTNGQSFTGTGRGGDLRDHDDYVKDGCARSAGLIDADATLDLWRRLRNAPGAGQDVMSHTDLTPPNLIVKNGRLAGVLDSGGFGPADPALDLIAFWHLFDDPVRTNARLALRSDDREWARAAAWALVQSIGLVWYYESTNPVMSELGRQTMERLTTDRGLRTMRFD